MKKIFTLAAIISIIGVTTGCSNGETEFTEFVETYIVPSPSNIQEITLDEIDFHYTDLNLTAEEIQAVEKYQTERLSIPNVQYEFYNLETVYEGATTDVGVSVLWMDTLDKVLDWDLDRIDVESFSGMFTDGRYTADFDLVSHLVKNDTRELDLNYYESNTPQVSVSYTNGENIVNNMSYLEGREIGHTNGSIYITQSDLDEWGVTATIIELGIAENVADWVNADDNRVLITGLNSDVLVTTPAQFVSRFIPDKFEYLAINNNLAESDILGSVFNKIFDAGLAEVSNNYVNLFQPMKVQTQEFLSQSEIDLLEYFETNPLQVYPEHEFEPLSYFKDGEYRGSNVDKFKRLAAVAGLNYDLVEHDLTYDEIVNRMGGNGDPSTIMATLSMGRTDYHETFAKITDPFATSPINFLAINGKADYINSLEEMQFRKIGGITGYTYMAAIKDLYPYIEVAEYASNDELYEALKNDEIEYMMSSSDYTYNHMILGQDHYDLFEAFSSKVDVEFSLGISLDISEFSVTDLVSIINRMGRHVAVSDIDAHQDSRFDTIAAVLSTNEQRNRTITITIILASVVLAAGIIIFIIASNNKKESHLARTDRLTGIGNRLALSEFVKVEGLVKRSIAFIDLNGFKRINDVYGHGVGDELLINLSKSFDKASGITPYRYGGDEFVIISDEAVSGNEFAHLIDSVNRTFIFSSVKNEIEVDFSAGIISSPPEKYDLSEILTLIDIGMYSGKMNQERFTIIDRDKLKQIQKLNDKEKLLFGDISDGSGLFAVFQPQISIATDKIIGVECLSRWRLDGEDVAPAEYFNIVEKLNVAYEVDVATMVSATSLYKKLLATGKLEQSFKIAFNLSSNFIERTLKSVVGGGYPEPKLGIPPKYVTFEILESQKIDEPQLKYIKALVEMGYNVAIDDYGSGESSLDGILNSSANDIKFDMTLLPNNDTEVGRIRTLKKLIEIFKGAGKKIILEGVETEWQYSLAKESNCDIVQGYFIAKPMREDEVLSFIDEKNL